VVAKLLVIDNYDSFTYNLVQMFMQYDLDIIVHRSDQVSIDEVACASPDYILISPGPKDPANAGISKSLIQTFYQTMPILGVCLGMQCINEVFGGRTVRAKTPMHGKTSRVLHQKAMIFDQIPSPFTVARYHSLAVQPSREALSEHLTVTGRSADGTIMGLSHQHFPLHGVQFHPESFLTAYGFSVIENFLKQGPLKHELGFNTMRHSASPFYPTETSFRTNAEMRPA
jgi:anthranilate synthase component 2